MRAFAERFVLSIKLKCIGRMIFFGTEPLERAIREYVAHYPRERNPQGIGNATASVTGPRVQPGRLTSLSYRCSGAAARHVVS